jgi:hypothetical protein
MRDLVLALGDDALDQLAAQVGHALLVAAAGAPSARWPSE